MSQTSKLTYSLDDFRAYFPISKRHLLSPIKILPVPGSPVNRAQNLLLLEKSRTSKINECLLKTSQPIYDQKLSIETERKLVDSALQEEKPSTEEVADLIAIREIMAEREICRCKCRSNGSNSKTALMAACQSRDHELVRRLLKNHKGINEQSASGFSAFHFLLEKNRNCRFESRMEESEVVKTAEILLNNKGNICTSTNSGETVLHFGCRTGSVLLVSTLLRLGCTPNHFTNCCNPLKLQNFRKETPYDATPPQFREIRGLLANWESIVSQRTKDCVSKNLSVNHY